MLSALGKQHERFTVNGHTARIGLLKPGNATQKSALATTCRANHTKSIMFFYYVVFVSSGLDGICVSIIALGVYTSGSLYKIFKIHITQISKEQYESALMLGLSERQVYRYVILPQALKTAMPLLAGELKLLLRSTSYTGYIAQKDLVKAADAIQGQTYEAFVPLLVISLAYLALSWAITELLCWLYKKLFVHG